MVWLKIQVLVSTKCLDIVQVPLKNWSVQLSPQTHSWSWQSSSINLFHTASTFTLYSYPSYYCAKVQLAVDPYEVHPNKIFLHLIITVHDLITANTSLLICGKYGIQTASILVPVYNQCSSNAVLYDTCQRFNRHTQLILKVYSIFQSKLFWVVCNWHYLVLSNKIVKLALVHRGRHPVYHQFKTAWLEVCSYSAGKQWWPKAQLIK